MVAVAPELALGTLPHPALDPSIDRAILAGIISQSQGMSAEQVFAQYDAFMVEERRLAREEPGEVHGNDDDDAHAHMRGEEGFESTVEVESSDEDGSYRPMLPAELTSHPPVALPTRAAVPRGRAAGKAPAAPKAPAAKKPIVAKKANNTNKKAAGTNKTTTKQTPAAAKKALIAAAAALAPPLPLPVEAAVVQAVPVKTSRAKAPAAPAAAPDAMEVDVAPVAASSNPPRRVTRSRQPSASASAPPAQGPLLMAHVQAGSRVRAPSASGSRPASRTGSSARVTPMGSRPASRAASAVHE